MFLLYTILGFGLLTSTSALVPSSTRRSCTVDLCLRGLDILPDPPRSRAPYNQQTVIDDCRSYLALWYTPTISVTVTAKQDATTSQATATTTIYEGTTRASLMKRQDIAPTTYAPIPTYASYCSGGAQYTSACSCLGVVRVSTATQKMTITKTVTIPYTSTSTVSLSAPTTVIEPNEENIFDGSYQIDLPFEVELYGNKSSTVWMSDNGFLSFTEGLYWRTFWNQDLPLLSGTEYRHGLPGVAVCGYWDDGMLVPARHHGLYYGLTGQPGSYVAMFEWYIGLYSSPDTLLHFFMVYEEAHPNITTIHYLKMDATGQSALIGAQSYPRFFQYSNNQGGVIHDGMILKLDTTANTMTQIL